MLTNIKDLDKKLEFSEKNIPLCHRNPLRNFKIRQSCISNYKKTSTFLGKGKIGKVYTAL